MTEQFYDSSAFAKLFIREQGTDEMLNLYRAAQRRVVSKVAFVEVYAAIRRREREGDLSKSYADTACALLRAEEDRVEVVEVSSRVVAEAQNLVDQQQIRSLDLIQLSSARQSGDVVFVCADDRLRNAAHDQGFQVIDPR